MRRVRACAWRLENDGGVFTLLRTLAGGTLAAVYNLTDRPQAVPAAGRLVFGSQTAGAPALAGGALTLPPYGFAWLAPSA